MVFLKAVVGVAITSIAAFFSFTESRTAAVDLFHSINWQPWRVALVQISHPNFNNSNDQLNSTDRSSGSVFTGNFSNDSVIEDNSAFIKTSNIVPETDSENKAVTRSINITVSSKQSFWVHELTEFLWRLLQCGILALTWTFLTGMLFPQFGFIRIFKHMLRRNDPEVVNLMKGILGPIQPESQFATQVALDQLVTRLDNKENKENSAITILTENFDSKIEDKADEFTEKLTTMVENKVNESVKSANTIMETKIQPMINSMTSTVDRKIKNSISSVNAMIDSKVQPAVESMTADFDKKLHTSLKFVETNIETILQHSVASKVDSKLSPIISNMHSKLDKKIAGSRISVANIEMEMIKVTRSMEDQTTSVAAGREEALKVLARVEALRQSVELNAAASTEGSEMAHNALSKVEALETSLPKACKDAFDLNMGQWSAERMDCRFNGMKTKFDGKVDNMGLALQAVLDRVVLLEYGQASAHSDYAKLQRENKGLKDENVSLAEHVDRLSEAQGTLQQHIEALESAASENQAMLASINQDSMKAREKLKRLETQVNSNVLAEVKSLKSSTEGVVANVKLISAVEQRVKVLEATSTLSQSQSLKTQAQVEQVDQYLKVQLHPQVNVMKFAIKNAVDSTKCVPALEKRVQVNEDQVEKIKVDYLDLQTKQTASQERRLQGVAQEMKRIQERLQIEGVPETITKRKRTRRKERAKHNYDSGNVSDGTEDLEPVSSESTPLNAAVDASESERQPKSDPTSASKEQISSKTYIESAWGNDFKENTAPESTSPVSAPHQEAKLAPKEMSHEKKKQPLDAPTTLEVVVPTPVDGITDLIGGISKLAVGTTNPVGGSAKTVDANSKPIAGKAKPNYVLKFNPNPPGASFGYTPTCLQKVKSLPVESNMGINSKETDVSQAPKELITNANKQATPKPSHNIDSKWATPMPTPTASTNTQSSPKVHPRPSTEPQKSPLPGHDAEGKPILDENGLPTHNCIGIPFNLPKQSSKPKPKASSGGDWRTELGGLPRTLPACKPKAV